MHALVTHAPGAWCKPDSAVEMPVDPLALAGYDAGVASHPEATVFHSSAWLRVLHETYGFKPLCFMTRSGSLLPVMEADSPVSGRRGICLPFTDECAPLVGSESEFQELWEAALAHGRERRWKYFELRDKAFLREAPASLQFCGHVLDLCADEDRLFAGLESSVRTAIRKARHSGVTVQHRSDADAMRTYYDLHCKTRKKHGLPPQPWAFFLNIQRHMLSKGMGSLVLANINDTYVAGAVFFHTAKKALYKFGASDEVWQSVRANDLVMWEAIKWLGQKGFERLDFGRTSQTNEGLRRFKRGWSAREEVREYVKFALRTESFVLDQERTQGYHNQIFRRLPMRLLRAAGAILYRHSA